MDYITVREDAEKLSILGQAINYHIIYGCISGTIEKGSLWFIPKSVIKPEDKYRSKYQPEKDTL